MRFRKQLEQTRAEGSQNESFFIRTKAVHVTAHPSPAMNEFMSL